MKRSSYELQRAPDSARKCAFMASQTQDGNTKEALIECVLEWLDLASLARQKEASESALPKVS
jgi:hypothetical protein